MKPYKEASRTTQHLPASPHTGPLHKGGLTANGGWQVPRGNVTLSSVLPGRTPHGHQRDQPSRGFMWTHLILSSRGSGHRWSVSPPLRTAVEVGFALLSEESSLWRSACVNRVTITSGQRPRRGVGGLHTSQTLVGMQSFILPSAGSGVPASPVSPLGTISGGGLRGRKWHPPSLEVFIMRAPL